MARKVLTVTAAAVFLLFLLFITPACSARPFKVYVSDGLAATEPTLNVDLLTDNSGSSVLDKGSKGLSACDNMASGEALNTRTTTLRKLKGSTHRPLVLNVLLKGKIPPSGPSHGSNSVKN